jgi:Uma2 family endonuclease
MSAAVLERLMTAEDLRRLPRGRERRELIEGVLHTMSPSGAEHVVVSAELLRRLGNHVHEHALGRTFSGEGGFVICRNPDTVIAPDAAFVTAERMAVCSNAGGHWEGAPDPAVLGISSHDRMADVDDEVDACRTAGTRLAGVIHAWRRVVRIHRPDRPVPWVRADEFPDGREVVRGIRRPFDEILVT